MGRFDRVLRRADRRLEAPEPERSRILLEMAADLEDLYESFRERGLGDEEARRKAADWMAPSPEALSSLRSVHVPGFERALGRLGGTLRGRIEVGFLALVSVGAAAAGAAAVLQSALLSAPTPGLWAVAGLATAGLATGLSQAYRLFVRGDRLEPGWRRDLRRVLAAAAGTGVAGLLAGGLRLTLATASPSGTLGGAAFWSEVSAAAGLATLGLCASLLLALVWLLLRLRADAVSRARAELRGALGRPDHAEAEAPVLDDTRLRRETTP